MSKTIKSNDFKPSLLQLKYLEAFILSEDRINITKLAKEIGVNRVTIYKWEQNDDFAKWFSEQTIKAFTRSLPRVHKGMETRATKKYLDAMLYLKRFDPDFRDRMDIKAKYDITLSDKLKKMSDEELDKIIGEEIKDDGKKE